MRSLMDINISEFYELIYKITNNFLVMADKFTISELKKKHDPTMLEIAEDATDLSKIMNSIADDKWDDERLALNAAQAALHMRRAAIAVRNENKELFEQAINDLASLSLV